LTFSSCVKLFPHPTAPRQAPQPQHNHPGCLTILLEFAPRALTGPSCSGKIPASIFIISLLNIHVPGEVADERAKLDRTRCP
jgi:hypothetical protein